jgi:hypothetical protein
MINHPPRIVPESMPPPPSVRGERHGGRMTVVGSSGARRAGRTIVGALGLAAVLATLAGCAAGDIAGGVATPTSAAAAGPAVAAPATAAPAATMAAAPKPAPQVLSPTEINEQCWMSNEVNKLKDLDAKAKLVDKCVAERMKAQGM